MPKKAKKLMPDVVRRTISSNPAIRSAFDDGAKHGRTEARQEILGYLLDDYIMDQGLERTDPKYQAALDIIRTISDKFKTK